jgi:hypothetical protein
MATRYAWPILRGSPRRRRAPQDDAEFFARKKKRPGAPGRFRIVRDKPVEDREPRYGAAFCSFSIAGAKTAVVEVGIRRGFLASVLFLEPLHNPKPKVVFMEKIN